MEREELKTTLNQLHEELQQGTQIDSETQALLGQVSEDIQRVLSHSESHEADPFPAPAQKKTLLDQLLGLTEEFEDSHPQLAEAIGRVATALSRIGI